MITVEALREKTLAFVARHHVKGGEIGAYRYSTAAEKATLYSSAYAVLIRSLYNDLDSLTREERQAWIAYFNRHQDKDGLYRDPVIFDQGWYKDDPLWCGRPHLTGHVIMALTCLGSVAPKPLAFIEPYKDIEALRTWLEERDWGERVAWTGNEIMNVGTLLQYMRDFHDDSGAGDAVAFLLDWLDTHWIDPQTGVWGELDVSDPTRRSHAVQAAFHWWLLYFYDGRRPPQIDRAINTLLATQNPDGGFGWGVHNPNEPFKSSACEDIDSIDPLARMSALTDYRRHDIRQALTKAAKWVLQNRMAGGGFVFVLDRPFEYGHPELRGEVNTGAMFPTWFRTLSLAILAQALPGRPLAEYPWNFPHCPGYQFWDSEEGGVA